MDRRKSERLPIKLHLEVNKLFKQEYIVLDNINAQIDVVNISRTGIGFICKEELPIYYYFNTKIELPNNNYFYSVIKIVRKEDHENYFVYGCEFIGLAEFLADKVDEYKELSDLLDDNKACSKK